MLTPDQALKQGFTIDDSCYPWCAYKGLRFAPTELVECFTDLEAALMLAAGSGANGIHSHVFRSSSRRVPRPDKLTD